MGGIAGLLLGQRIGKSGLPDICGNRLDLIVSQAEVRHFCGRPEVCWLLEPDGNPILVELEPDVFQIRPDLLHVLHQTVSLKVELLNVAVNLAVLNF